MRISPNKGRIFTIRKRKFLCFCQRLIGALGISMLIVAIGFSQTTQEERLKKLNVQVDELMDQQKYFEAMPIAQEALKLAEEIFGPEHVEVANALYNIGGIFYRQRKFNEAEPLIRRCLAIYEETFGTEHPEVAKALNRLGANLHARQNYKEAVSLYRRALTIYEKAYGPEHPEVAKLLGNLALLNTNLGKYAEAEPLYQRSLAITEKIYGPDHPQVAHRLARLALNYRNQSKYVKAEELYKRALYIEEKAYGPDHPEVTDEMNLLADNYVSQNKYEEAEDFYTRALRIREKAYGPEHINVSYILDDLGYLYQTLGKYEEAEDFYTRALQIREKTYGPEHPRVSHMLNRLAELYTRIHKFGQAEPLLERALRIDEKAYGLDHPRVAPSLGRLANLCDFQGKFTEAAQLSQRALRIQEKVYGPDHRSLLGALGLLAHVYIRHLGKYAEAESLVQRALKIAEKSLGPDHYMFPLYLENLATLYKKTQKYDEAEPILRCVLQITEKAYGPDHPIFGKSLEDLAELYIIQSKYAEAEPLLLRALQIAEHAYGFEHEDVLLFSEMLGNVYYAQGLQSKAQDSFDHCLQSFFKLFEYHFTYMSEGDRLKYLDRVSEAFPLYFSFCFTYKDQNPALIGEMYNVLLWQKGFIARSISSLRSQIAAGGDAEAITLLDKLTGKKTQLANLLVSNPEELDKWRPRIEQLEKEADELEKELVRRSSALVEQKRLAQVTWQEVQKALKQNEAAVEFVRFKFHDGKGWTDKTYYAALIVTPESTVAPTLVLLAEEDELEGAPLEEYRKLVGAKIRPLARDEDTLYDAFWGPLETALAEIKRIYLSPDGFFNLISWASLPAGDGRMLMEKYDIRTVSSTKDILRKKLSHKATSAVLIGNPRFNLEETQQIAAARSFQSTEQPNLLLAALERGLRSRDHRGEALTPLLSTKEELQSIQSLLKKEGWPAEVYSEENAIEEAIKNVHSPRILHVATHGFFLPDQVIDQPIPDHPSSSENPMLRSGLYFAGADRVVLGESTPPGLEDGVLTAYEATGLNLHGTELVVLSACETGLGEVKNGEGVFGLRRAFQVAGAEAVLMSLWPVADRETQELMTMFYDKWLSGKDKYEAFREAQMELRAKVKERYGHDLPFYWAAFVVVGR